MKEEFGRVEILFPAVEEKRVYAMEHTPVRRVVLREGERLETNEGEEFVVREVLEDAGLVTYRAGRDGEETTEVPEARLSDRMSFTSPRDRVIAGRFDESRMFELRGEALERQGEIRRSRVRGLVGARVDLIPHQLAIAAEVTSRPRPRVLLADEVGLGKTIEACLIMHRLHLTGRADRVLILVPEPLVHQWFVELLRRFQMTFAIFDEDRCRAIEAAGGNPFLDSQLVLAATDFASAPGRADQLREAGWDLLIVDEAHHLEWSPEEESASYQLVDGLAKETEAVLLLTATPQQLGPEGHFARLRLLDPDRYSDLPHFLEEMAGYERIAGLVEELQEGRVPEAAGFADLPGRIQSLREKLTGGDESAREELVGALIDLCGTGRIMFRNTRQQLQGFPERKVLPAPLATDGLEARLDWLVGILKSLESREKVLLICATREDAEAVGEGLRERINLKQAVFHEGLTLIQRDRHAAYFAEEDGARVLICSEIGSEGRNFQFAHHLVLLDLPADPDLLEQRIGRLDRIGQTETIKIHVPYAQGGREEFLWRWYHEGLNAFEEHLKTGTEISRELSVDWSALGAADVEPLLEKTRRLKEELNERLSHGHDRLLELSLPDPEETSPVLAEIEAADNDGGFEEFVLQLLDRLGFQVDDLTTRGYLIGMGEMAVDALPDLPEEGMSVTFDRTRALGREDLTFMSRDHPTVRGAMDHVLGSDLGNAAFGVWEAPGEKAILLEAHYVVEALAPAHLHVERFLPARPLWLALDHGLKPLPEESPLRKTALRGGKFRKLLGNPKVRDELLPAMFEKLDALAGAEALRIREKAVGEAEAELEGELERLRALAEGNPAVTAEEIAEWERRKALTLQALAEARIRLDSVRLVWREPK